MNITTTYKTNASGRSQIVAKSNGKQRTVNFDQSKSAEWNHGTAAGTLLLAIAPNAARILVHPDSVQTITHESSDDGVRHTFRISG